LAQTKEQLSVLQTQQQIEWVEWQQLKTELEGKVKDSSPSRWKMEQQHNSQLQKEIGFLIDRLKVVNTNKEQQ
jgi:hypothetical protein